jgi:hypothetical protein
VDIKKIFYKFSKKSLTLKTVHDIRFIVRTFTDLEVIPMEKKSGRPTVADKRDNRIEVKMNTEELMRLDYCVMAKDMDRAKIIRDGVDMVYDSITDDAN